jgi:diadenosine tetraphosphate (Ap4A) HIT family hydrolase
MEPHVTNTNTSTNTNLFLVHLHIAPGNDGPYEWHGTILSVNDGIARSFSDWPALLDAILDMQARCESSGSTPQASGPSLTG